MAITLRISAITTVALLMVAMSWVVIDAAPDANATAPATNPDIWKRLGLPEEPYKVFTNPEFENDPFLKNCLHWYQSKSLSCGGVIILHLLRNRAMKWPCCNLLMRMGSECNYRLLKTFFNTPLFGELNKDKLVGPRKDIIIRSYQLWNTCAAGTGRIGRRP